MGSLFVQKVFGCSLVSITGHSIQFGWAIGALNIQPLFLLYNTGKDIRLLAAMLYSLPCRRTGCGCTLHGNTNFLTPSRNWRPSNTEFIYSESVSIRVNSYRYRSAPTSPLMGGRVKRKCKINDVGRIKIEWNNEESAFPCRAPPTNPIRGPLYLTLLKHASHTVVHHLKETRVGCWYKITCILRYFAMKE